MKLQYYRFFGPFLSAQEAWLNRMAERGYRLVKTGQLCYQFAPCTPGAVRYRIEFIAQWPAERTADYRQLLEELGCQSFVKNINLNYSVGKVRYRLWAKGAARLATNGTTFNRELLIVEKKNDGTPFELYTTAADWAAYYHTLRAVWGCTALLFALFAVLLLAQSFWSALLWGGLACAALVPLVACHRRMRAHRKSAAIQEESTDHGGKLR